MTTLTADQVRKIAKLARLRLSDDEVATFATELTKILAYVDLLKDVDTSGVDATAQVTGLHNAFREDVVRPQEATPDQLLACSPLPITEHQIQTPSAHGN